MGNVSTSHTAFVCTLLFMMAHSSIVAVPKKNKYRIPATAIISYFLAGIDELGLQLEEPFSVLYVDYDIASLAQPQCLKSSHNVVFD